MSLLASESIQQAKSESSGETGSSKTASEMQELGVTQLDEDGTHETSSSSEEDGKGENKKGQRMISFLCCKTRIKQCLVYRESVAENISFIPIRWLANQPQIAGAITLVAYAVFCILWLAWAPMAFLLGEAGAWLVFFWLMRSAGGYIARFATFPGSFGSVRQDVEREYGRRLGARLEQGALVFESWWLSLHPRGGRPEEANVILEALAAARQVKTESLEPLRDAMSAVISDLSQAKKIIAWGDIGQESTLSVSAVEAAEAVYQAMIAVIKACEPLEIISESLAVQEDIAAGRLALNLNPDASRAIYSLANACRELARVAPYCLAPPKGHSSSSSRGSSRRRRGNSTIDNTLRKRFMRLGSDLMSAAVNACRAPCPAPLDTGFSLSLMRAELARRMGATQIWLGAVDCCIVPPYFERRSNGILPTATVLFCAPNAVLYESFGMAPRDSTGWLASYARAGLQVLIWNPAGYGRRKGSPSPRQNLRDGISLVTALIEAGVSSLLIHGESIGALAATGLAAHCCSLLSMEKESTKLKRLALVADRSFSNLAVEAQYLTGFKAAGPLLPLVTGWWPTEADSSAQYRRVTCPKLITCDAKDHMIPDPASLKAGVALFSELGQVSPRKIDLSGSLALTDAQGSIPHGLDADSVKGLKIEGTPGPLKANELEVAFAAARYIGRVALRRFYADFEEYSWQAVDLEHGVTSDDTPRLRRTQSRRRNLSANKAVKKNRRRSRSPYPPEKNSGGMISSESEPLELSAWAILERIDGGSGMSLGRVLASDFGSFRAWACSYVSWPNGAPNKLLDGNLDPWTGGDDPADADEDIESFSVSEAATKISALLPHEDTSDLVLVLRFLVAFLTVLQRRAEFNAMNPTAHELLGDLLVLGCGHNAPYSTAERDAFFAWLRAHFDDSLWPAQLATPDISPFSSAAC